MGPRPPDEIPSQGTLGPPFPSPALLSSHTRGSRVGSRGRDAYPRSSPYTNSKGPLSTSLQMMKNDPGTPLPPKGVHNGFSAGPLDAGGAGTSTLGMLN